MNFQVPQFIEVEDKIFGPLTFKQFAYIAGGAGICFLIYVYVRLISFILAIILVIPVGGFFLALAFQQVNGRPMIVTLEAAFKYAKGKKLYLWQKGAEKTKPTTLAQTTEAVSNIPKLSESKLRDLSWSLDIEKHIE